MSAAPNPYDARRVGRGALHFLLGKGVTSIAGICTLLLVIRGLDRPEFAAYSILVGLVELVTAVTNVGTGQIMSRYVPEVYSRGYRYALWRMVSVLLVIRYLVLAAVLLAVAQFVPAVSRWIGLADWQTAFGLYLLVVLFRAVGSTIFQVLESMLLQGGAQVSMSLMAVIRLLLVSIAYATGHLDLVLLIQLELATDIATALVLGWVLFNAARTSKEPGSAVESQWLRDNRRRMLSFGLKGYAQHLIILPFSGVVNRLVMGAGFGAAGMAVFGLAQSVFDLMQRFLPAQLLVGLYRPVMAARFSRNGGFGEVVILANLILKLNLLLIGLCAVALFGGGSDLVSLISGGKYGADVVGLLLLMLALLCLDTWRHVIDVTSHTVERYGVFVYANAILGSSLLLGLALLPSLGLYALPFANGVGLLVSCPIVLWWLRRTGFRFRHDRAAIIGIAGAAAAAGLAALGVRALEGNWVVSMIVAVLVYLSICALVLLPRGRERRFLRQVFSMTRGGRRSTAFGERA